MPASRWPRSRRCCADEDAARQRNKAAFLATADDVERRAIVLDAIARLERQLGLLDSKIERLTEMRDDVAARADRARGRLAELDRRYDDPLPGPASAWSTRTPSPIAGGCCSSPASARCSRR